MFYYNTRNLPPDKRLVAAFEIAASDLEGRSGDDAGPPDGWFSATSDAPPDVHHHGEVICAVRRWLEHRDSGRRVSPTASAARRGRRERRRRDAVASAMIRMRQCEPAEVQVIRAMCDAGAFLLSVRDDKSPVRRSWNRRRERVDGLARHYEAGGRIGVIPASLGYTVVDVDVWNYDGLGRLLALFPPDLITPTSKGFHLWYRDDAGRRPRTWRLFGCSGDVVSDDAYVVLWQGPRTIHRLSQADREIRFPMDVFSVLPRAHESGSRPPADHSPGAQSRRGVNSGMARRQLADVRAGIAKRMIEDGRSHREIAKSLGVTDRTVRNYLAGDAAAVVDAERALRWLRRLLKDGNPGRFVVARAIARAETNLWGGRGVSRGVESELAGDAGAGVGEGDWERPSRRAVLLAYYCLRVADGPRKARESAGSALERYLRGVERRAGSRRRRFVELWAREIGASGLRMECDGMDFLDVFRYVAGGWRTEWNASGPGPAHSDEMLRGGPDLPGFRRGVRRCSAVPDVSGDVLTLPSVGKEGVLRESASDTAVPFAARPEPVAGL